ncbi:MAG: hypothetical protein C0621_08260 [Desulfuromonas sp.]|nr:MAG: hypothetical protein C0621_08260 [Desulfuromonas sp.]
MRQLTETHFFTEKIHLTLSCGVTQMQGKDDSHRVVMRADDALYKAKHEGRNRVEVVM